MIKTFAVSIISLLAVAAQAYAQGLTITPLDAQRLNLQVPNGDSLELSLPDLTGSLFSIGYDTRIFEVASGDFLSEATINSFVLLETNSAPPNPNSSLSDLPLGRSFIGFSAFDVGGPARTIGWAQLLRTPDTLAVLASDSVFSTAPDSSFGTFVPSAIPEPTATLLGCFGIGALMRDRRRRQQNCGP